ncbi:MAG TPA: hypothetical protein VLC71_12925 [Thermomonas sp.]|nr:hypothetical protein [Thermomonas sp.]
MAIRVLFVPFQYPDKSGRPGETYKAKNAHWISMTRQLRDGGDTHSVLECWYHPSIFGNPLLSRLGKYDQVYIRGHCIPGFDGIFDLDARVDESGKNVTAPNVPRPIIDYLHDRVFSQRLVMSLTTQQVVQRLTGSGLSPGFAGKIKCYNCHSAENGEQGDPSFAARVKAQLAALAYVDCKVYGYTGSLSSSHEAALGHKTSLRQDSTSVRASIARVEV